MRNRCCKAVQATSARRPFECFDANTAHSALFLPVLLEHQSTSNRCLLLDRGSVAEFQLYASQLSKPLFPFSQSYTPYHYHSSHPPLPCPLLAQYSIAAQRAILPHITHRPSLATACDSPPKAQIKSPKIVDGSHPSTTPSHRPNPPRTEVPNGMSQLRRKWWPSWKARLRIRSALGIA